ncbi:MAG: phage tail sheath subtilisin-like domain-containing protein [Candidatus Thiodiazotropha sp. (ex Lucinoma borealis)]|nr:phage tail sheath subtilisin-like domain-containing protein [Candidatus Thiodiazotropha sp. (ex Lucinoma borealis)]
MPEYLSPGVYVEETSFRARSIEGVATSTAGFVGQSRFGPIEGEPQLVTSFDEFERYYGSLNDLNFNGVPVANYLAHAVNLFFENGGKRVYIARIFEPAAANTADDSTANGNDLIIAPNQTRFRARFPGLAGNLSLLVDGTRSGNLLTGAAGNRVVNGLRPGDMVETNNGPAKTRQVGVVSAANPVIGDALVVNDVYYAHFDDQGNLTLTNSANVDLDIQAPALESVQKLTLSVRVISAIDGREDAYQGLSTHPASDQFLGRVLRHEDPNNGVEPPVDRTARIYLQTTTVPTIEPNRYIYASELLLALLSDPNHRQLMTGGDDGIQAPPDAFAGAGVDHTTTGLVAIGDVEDVAIVAAPGAAALGSTDDRQSVRNFLITHCENLRYRFAILSADQNHDTAGIREVRGQHDSKYAALYYPWLVVRNPFNSIGQGRDTLLLPPDGAIAGIYARSDIERGVHKAPANEVVRNVLRFSRNVNKGQQDTLNPEGINCLRFFEGRGYRVWGARTISSDPEWTYLNVRRLFIFMEHSIDNGTQWAVFEPNNETLWLKIRLTIESFLYDVWRTGALMGTKPEEAYFVRCDRTTMSQGDLDNGRLVCLIGVAPTKPAEFVIFRIGQWTADASIL